MANNNGGQKKEYAPEVGLWNTKGGTGYSALLTPDAIETLTKLLATAKEGMTLFVGPNKFKKEGSKQPDYRISVIDYNARKEANADGDI